MKKQNERVPFDPEPGLPLADCHCHLPWQVSSKSQTVPPDLVYNDFFTKFGRIMVSSSVDWPSLEAILKFQEEHPKLKMAAGWAPQTVTYTEPQEHHNQFLKWIQYMIQNTEKYVAIGEIGLDFHHARRRDQRNAQIEVFQQIIHETRLLGKPYMIHVRNASPADVDPASPDDKYNLPDAVNKKICEIFNGEGIKPSSVMWHCFSGPAEWGVKLAEEGFYLSVPASAFGFKRWRQCISDVPLSQLLTETDSPFQHPTDYGKFNTSLNVGFSRAAIAFTLGISQKEVADTVINNALRFFWIKE